MASQVAGYIGNINIGDDTSYSIGSTAYGYCETAAGTAAKVVDMTGFKLVTGATIYVKFKEKNSAANPTLNVNGTGAKPIYRYGTTAAGTTDTANCWAAGAVLALTYDGVGWIYHFWYNNQYNLANNNLGGGNFTANSVIYRYQLLFHTTREKLTPLNNDNNVTGTTKTMLTTVDLDLSEKIYYYDSTTTVNANAAVSGAALYFTRNSIDLRYTFNCGNSSLTAQKDVFLKLSRQANGLFRIANATPTTQTLPTTNDGYYYCLLGRSTSAYALALYEDHPIYYHDGTSLCEVIFHDHDDRYALIDHNHDSSYTSSSVIPNNSGEIKTKYRVSNKAYTGSNTWYYPLAQLPKDGASNFASLIISGRVGGWNSGNMAYFQALVWNRDNTGIACFTIAGTATAESSIFNVVDIVCYENSDTTETVYLKCKGYYTFDVDLELFQSSAQLLYDGTYSAETPTGTLTASASASAKRITLINGKLMVAGTEAKLTDTTYTGTNGISLSGTTFSNSGVRSIATGSTNGTISVDTNGTSAEVAVKGLGTAAYTASTDYLSSSGGTVTGDLTVTGEISGGNTGYIYYVVGTQTAATSAWTGSLPEVSALYDGLIINYCLPVASTSTAVTLNLTLKGGTTTGAVNVFYSGTTRMTNHYGAAAIVPLVYRTINISGTNYTGWWCLTDRDANTTDIVNLYEGAGNFVAQSALYRYQLIFQVNGNVFTPLNNNNNVTATTKTMLTNVEFMVNGKIYYYGSSTDVAANGAIGNACYYHRQSVDMRYTFNISNTAFIAHSYVYLKVTKQNNGKAKIASADPLVQSLPSSNDGYLYILLGRASSGYQMTLYTEHPIYYHDGTSIKEWRSDVVYQSYNETLYFI